MKLFLIPLFLILTFDCLSQSEFIRADFQSEGGRYYISPNYVHLPKILLRVRMGYKNDQYGSITDFYWQIRNVGFEFYFIGQNLYFSKYDIRTKDEFWAILVESCRATIYTERIQR